MVTGNRGAEPHAGLSRHTGSITKTGNAHVRRCLMEAAWAFRHPARRTLHLNRRLRARGKPHKDIITAIARELVGFLWATVRLVSPHATATTH